MALAGSQDRAGEGDSSQLQEFLKSCGEEGTGEGLGFSTDLLQAGFTAGSEKDLAIYRVCFASQSGTVLFLSSSARRKG